MAVFQFLLILMTLSLAVADNPNNEDNEDLLQTVLKELKELRDNQRECNARLAELDTLKLNHRDLFQEFIKVKTRVEELETIIDGRYDHGADDTSDEDFDEQSASPTAELNKNDYVDGESETKATINNLGNISNPRSGIVKKRQSQGIRVAFTACVSVLDLKELGAHHTIIFDRAITNIGSAYHQHTGIFIVPYTGVYVFHLAALENAGKTMYLNLMIDGAQIANIYVDASGLQGYGSAGNLWIKELSKGSEVWIQSQYPGEIHGNCYPTFSGWLLYATE